MNKNEYRDHSCYAMLAFNDGTDSAESIYRATVVHSRELKLREDHLLVYGANSHGEVIAAACSLDT